MGINLDNEAIYEICQKWLDRRRPSFDNMNVFMRKPIASITSTWRYQDKLGNRSFDDFITMLVPFPRLHHMITGYAPVVTQKKCETQRTDWNDLTESGLSPRYFLTRLNLDLYLLIVISM